MKKVFVDFHHSDLFYSFILLFEKRLGFEVYRPIGLEWFYEGYWKIAEPYNNNIDTVKQYLDINDKHWDAFSNLNGVSKNGSNYIKDGIYYCFDPFHQIHHKAITFSKFKEMKFDYIISTISQHDNVYEELKNKYQPQAIHICQIGNNNQISTGKYIMCSTSQKNFPPTSKVFYYHQEFDLNVYKFTPIKQTKKIRSFVNCLPQTPDYPLYLKVKEILEKDGWDFKSYGGGCDNGSLSSQFEISNEIMNSQFVWHIKHIGDGYGHILHNSAACGRPLIVKKEYYKGLLGEVFMEDGKTCIIVDNKNPEQIAEEIKFYSQPERLVKLSENIYNKFKEVVDFNKEEIEFRKFLDSVLLT